MAKYPSMSKPESAFSEGLQDIIAAESSIGLIDGKNSRLAYRGYDIHVLAAKSTFEETAYLLLRGSLPTSSQLTTFTKEISQ